MGEGGRRRRRCADERTRKGDASMASAVRVCSRDSGTVDNSDASSISGNTGDVYGYVNTNLRALSRTYTRARTRSPEFLLCIMDAAEWARKRMIERQRERERERERERDYMYAPDSLPPIRIYL
jgi:hypothetical protein